MAVPLDSPTRPAPVLRRGSRPSIREVTLIAGPPTPAGDTLVWAGRSYTVARIERGADGPAYHHLAPTD